MQARRGYQLIRRALFGRLHYVRLLQFVYIQLEHLF